MSHPVSFFPAKDESKLISRYLVSYYFTMFNFKKVLRKEKLMRVNNLIKKSLLAVVALLSSVFLTGCVMDSDQEIPASGDGTLTISIKSGDFDVPLTRAVTADPTATENVITTTQTVIAIFKSDGTLISAEVPELVDGKLTLNHTNSGVNWLADANTVYVVGNVPDAVKTALTGLTPGTDTQTTFGTAFSMSLAQALNVNSLAGAQIPMVGVASISNSGTNYTAAVNVNHMLTKVSLNSLGVDFSESPTPNASFQPEQVFLVNVPDNIGIDATGAISQAAVTNYYHGEVAGSTGDGANNNTGDNHEVPAYATTYTSAPFVTNQFNADATLGTAALTAQTVMTAESPVWLSTATAGSQAVQQYYFYTLPNLAPAADAQKTKLVIRGSWKDNSSAAATEVYYAVPLANTAGLSTASLDANKNYKIDVIIKQKGATDAYADLPNDINATLAITSTITDFSDQDVVVGIGSGAYTPGTTPTAKVGDYFYSNGTWSSVYDNTKTLVGLVFSTNVSATDIAAGYTHGYVMALTDAGYDWNGGTPTKVKYKYRDYTAPTSGTKEAGFFNIGTTATQYTNDATYWQSIKTDLDGKSHTAAILADANETEYLAAHAANDYNTTHAVTGTNSGWYLPSIGQLYALAYNFAGRTAWNGLTFYNNSKDREGAYSEYHNCYFAAGADVTTTAINNYLTARLVTAAGLTAGADYQPFIDRLTESATPADQWAAYWSSSDYSAFYGLRLLFHSNGNLYFSCDSKALAHYVRPVLAF